MRSTRAGGYATKVATLFATIIDEVNATHQLDLGPLTLRDILPHLSEGQQILAEGVQVKEHKVLAQSLIDTTEEAGGAFTGPLLGMISKPNAAGQVSVARVAELTGNSQSWVRANRKLAEEGKLGVLTDLQQAKWK